MFGRFTTLCMKGLSSTNDSKWRKASHIMQYMQLLFLLLNFNVYLSTGIIIDNYRNLLKLAMRIYLFCQSKYSNPVDNYYICKINPLVPGVH